MMMTTIDNLETTSLISSIPEIALVLELGCLLQKLRVDASTLEVALGRVIQHLGLEGTIFAIPTGFFAALRKEGSHSKTYLMRVRGGSPNLKRLAEAETLVDLLLSGELDVTSAREQLAKLATRQARFGFWSKTVASGLAAMGMASIWSGSWSDRWWGLIVGLLVGLGVNLAEKHTKTASLAPFIAGAISAFVSCFVFHVAPSTHYFTIVIGGIVCLIPGFELLVAMQELGTGNLVSGTARMAGAGLIFIFLTIGMIGGQQFGTYLWPQRHHKVILLVSRFPEIVIPSLTIVALAYLIIFQGRLTDYGWTLLVGILTWYGNYFCTIKIGDIASAGVTTLVLGAGCNYYAQRSRNPEIVILLPAILLILPGSLGIHGLTSIVDAQASTVMGIQTGFTYFYVTVALMLGLLTANALVSRRTF